MAAAVTVGELYVVAGTGRLHTAEGW